MSPGLQFYGLARHDDEFARGLASGPVLGESSGEPIQSQYTVLCPLIVSLPFTMARGVDQKFHREKNPHTTMEERGGTSPLKGWACEFWPVVHITPWSLRAVVGCLSTALAVSLLIQPGTYQCFRRFLLSINLKHAQITSLFLIVRGSKKGGKSQETVYKLSEFCCQAIAEDSFEDVRKVG